MSEQISDEALFEQICNEYCFKKGIVKETDKVKLMKLGNEIRVKKHLKKRWELELMFDSIVSVRPLPGNFAMKSTENEDFRIDYEDWR